MSSTATSHPHLGHLLLVDQLIRRQGKAYPKAVRKEAARELMRYRDQGLILQQYGKEQPMAKSTRSNAAPGPRTFAGQGIIFAIIDDREQIGAASARLGRITTIDVIADAIEAALDHGYETSEAIARYLTTSAFQHVPDKRARFNAVLKASDVVGAQMISKLLNAYNELEQLAEEEKDPAKKKDIRSEALGFAEAVNVVLSPFSCEDSEDPRLVNWEEIDRITEAFIKEQRLVRKERKGNPQ